MSSGELFCCRARLDTTVLWIWPIRSSSRLGPFLSPSFPSPWPPPFLHANCSITGQQETSRWTRGPHPECLQVPGPRTNPIRPAANLVPVFSPMGLHTAHNCYFLLHPHPDQIPSAYASFTTFFVARSQSSVNHSINRASHAGPCLCNCNCNNRVERNILSPPRYRCPSFRK